MWFEGVVMSEIGIDRSVNNPQNPPEFIGMDFATRIMNGVDIPVSEVNGISDEDWDTVVVEIQKQLGVAIHERNLDLDRPLILDKLTSAYALLQSKLKLESTGGSNWVEKIDKFFNMLKPEDIPKDGEEANSTFNNLITALKTHRIDMEKKGLELGIYQQYLLSKGFPRRFLIFVLGQQPF
jgi:hypothetical protein